MTIGKIYHDCRKPFNPSSNKDLQPQPTTSTIEAAALRIIILTTLWPGIAILLSKRDIDAAFKRILLSLFDIDLVASNFWRMPRLIRRLNS